jgi:hypothetical protein
MQFQNPTNGHMETASVPWLWTLCFGAFYFAVKGIWVHFFIGIVCGLITYGLSWLIYPFFASAIIRNHYLRNGWIEVGASTVNPNASTVNPNRSTINPSAGTVNLNAGTVNQGVRGAAQSSRNNEGPARFGLRQRATVAPPPLMQGSVWSGFLFWGAVAICGLIGLGAITAIINPEGARERMAQREAAKQAAAIEGATSKKREAQLAKTDWPSCAVTLANFMRLKAGMEYREVSNILNCNGVEISRTEIPGVPTTVMYEWKADHGFGNMNVMFQGDQLVNKAQFGLE